MGLSLGIHVGHDASCAVVKDGVLEGAIQLERITRQKHHAVESLWNRLPVAETLTCAGASIEDVDVIYTSFQGGCPGGYGLRYSLVDPSFDLFDPYAIRHRVVSHHLAHAQCARAYACSPDLAVLVCDYAGSSTRDGGDYDLSFSDWYGSITSAREVGGLLTECMSIYVARANTEMTLEDREFHAPHPMSESAVCSVATLYENVSRCVFGRANCHGSLMALAAFGENLLNGSEEFPPMIDVSPEGRVTYSNDWQHAVYADAVVGQTDGAYRLSPRAARILASRCQRATEQATLAHASWAFSLTGAKDVALAGGTFLNILANSRIAESGVFDRVVVPSVPNDAGVAVGCAFHGASRIGDSSVTVRHDRLGKRYSTSAVSQAIAARGRFVITVKAEPSVLAASLSEGSIVARCAGRSEFGPRALGGRSLLASPLLASNKSRLNVIKKREPWRPVAPIVTAEHFSHCFVGVNDSPWMTFAHHIRPEHRETLLALSHPDGSTRAQTLSRNQDAWLYELIEQFSVLSDYHILCNTSLNGPGEPIVEIHEQSIDWFLRQSDVDELLLDDIRVYRRPAEEALDNARLALNDATELRRSSRVTEADVDETQFNWTVCRRGRIFPINSCVIARVLSELGSPCSSFHIREVQDGLDLEELTVLVVEGYLKIME